MRHCCPHDPVHWWQEWASFGRVGGLWRVGQWLGMPRNGGPATGQVGPRKAMAPRKRAQNVLEGVGGVVGRSISRCIAVRRRLGRVWTRWSLFLPGQARSKSRWRPLFAAGEGRQRIEGSGYTKFGSGMPVQMRCKTRLVGTQNGERTFVNAVAYAKDVKRGRFDPVHQLWFGLLQRPRRSRILWVVSRGVLWGVAVRQNVFTGLQRAFVWHMSPGARLLEVLVLQTLTGTGYKPVVVGASGAAGHSAVQNERLKRVQGMHGG